MNFRLLPPAALEIRQAARYYETQVPGLGHDFIQEVRQPFCASLNGSKPGSRWKRTSAAVAPTVFPMESFIRLNRLRCWFLRLCTFIANRTPGEKIFRKFRVQSNLPA